jgi:hypothetical protein
MIRNSTRFYEPTPKQGTYELLLTNYPIFGGSWDRLQSQMLHIATRTVPVMACQPIRGNLADSPFFSGNDLPGRQTFGVAYLLPANDYPEESPMLSGAAHATDYADRVKHCIDIQAHGDRDVEALLPSDPIIIFGYSGDGDADELTGGTQTVKAARLNLTERGISPGEYNPHEYAALFPDELGLFAFSASDLGDGFVAQSRYRSLTIENTPSAALNPGAYTVSLAAPLCAQMGVFLPPGFAGSNDRLVLLHARAGCMYSATTANTQEA